MKDRLFIIVTFFAWVVLSSAPLLQGQGILLLAGNGPNGAAGASYYTEVTTDTPKAHWRMGEGSGTTLDNDQGTASYDMTTVASPTLGATSLINGDANTAITFNGTTQYASVTSALGITAWPVTLECWVKSTATGYITALSLSQAGSNSVYYDIGIDDTGKAFGRRRNTATFLINGTTTVNNGSPHHIVLVIASNTDARLYVDGAQEGSTDTNSTTWSGSIDTTSIAARIRTAGADSFFNGTIDEAAVYTSALSSTRVLAHWNAGKP